MAQDKKPIEPHHLLQDTPEGSREVIEHELARQSEASRPERGDTIKLVFRDHPGPENECFVEIENQAGRSINAGEWRERPDGRWELAITLPE
jgi:hypothetical protein